MPIKANQAFLRLIPNLKANIPACITTTKQRPARSIVVEVSMENIRTINIVNLNCQKWGILQNPVMDQCTFLQYLMENSKLQYMRPFSYFSSSSY